VPYTPLTASQVDATRPMTPYRTTRNALAEDMAQAMTADELRNFAEKVAGSTQQVANLDNGLYGVWGDDPLINDRLRGDYLGTDVDEQIKLAQEFFTRVPPLQRPVKAFRGIMVERPEAGTNAFSDFVRTWEVGDVIEEPGFMSTTIDRNIAEGYANGGRVIEIDIPKGTQVATPEMFGPALRSTEQELTLPPGTKLQITSITDDVIKAKVVPSDTPITKMQTIRDALLRYVDPEVTASASSGRTMNPVEELAAAKARAETEPVVRNLNAYRAKTKRVDSRALNKNMNGFLQDDDFNPITNGLDKQQYDALWRSYNPPGVKALLDQMGFKPYNMKGMLTTDFRGTVPLYNDDYFLKINSDYHNGMGNFIDVYKRPPVWDFADENQLQYLGQAYGFGDNVVRKLKTLLAE